MDYFNTSMFTGKIIGTAMGSIATCPICQGAYRFETKHCKPEEWRCHTCTKGRWENIETFESLIKTTAATKTSGQTVLMKQQQIFENLQDGQTASVSIKNYVDDSPDNVAGYITSDAKVGPALALLNESCVWYLDIETYSHELPRNGKDKPATDPFRNKIRLITIGDGPHAFTFDVDAIANSATILQAIRGKYIVGHNLKFDLKTIAVKYGRECLPDQVLDTMLMATLLHRARTAELIKTGMLSLKGVIERYMNEKVSKEEQASDWGATVLREEQIKYALTDVSCLPALASKLVRELNNLVSMPNERIEPDELGLTNKVARIENDCLIPLIRAELNGIPINPAIFDNEPQMQLDVKAMEARFINKYELKPTQVAKIRQMLQNDFDLELDDMKKTTLERFKTVVPIAEVLEYRNSVAGLKFLERMKGLLVEGKLYTSFNQISAPSGRMSTRPSVQSIPRGLKKKIYWPPDGWKIIRGDFPAIELRLAAIKSGEQSLIESFRQGKDPHRATAAGLSGKAEESIGDDDIERKTAKACNFGFLYGMWAKTFRIYAMPIIGRLLSEKEAEKFRAQFFKSYPLLEKWQSETRHKLKRIGGKAIVSTLYGRKIKIDKYTLALNVPVQGSGADLIKDALIRFDKAIIETGLSSRIINIIHDEIVVMAPNDEVEQAKELLRRSMESAADDMIGLFHTPVKPDVYGRDGSKIA